MPGDPKECREHARACAELAERARNPDHRRAIKELEQAWLKLAVDLEANQALLHAYPPSEAIDGSGPQPDLPTSKDSKPN